MTLSIALYSLVSRLLWAVQSLGNILAIWHGNSLCKFSLCWHHFGSAFLFLCLHYYHFDVVLANLDLRFRVRIRLWMALAERITARLVVRVILGWIFPCLLVVLDRFFTSDAKAFLLLGLTLFKVQVLRGDNWRAYVHLWLEMLQQN